VTITSNLLDTRITLTLVPQDFLVIHGTQLLGDELGAEYIRLREAGARADVTLQIVSAIGSASLCRGIFQLSRLVRAALGVLTVVGYPEEYLATLQTLGIDKLPGVRVISL
jgi:hypothetical protein